MVFQWTFSISLIVFVTQEIVCNELKLVQVVFRHGDRTRLKRYPTDPNPKSAFPQPYGSLTKLGKYQHYVLGGQIRSMYEGFLTTNPLEIKVNSSEYDRCLESAESFLASFYAPTDRFKFAKNVNWQPISIHSVPMKQDKALDTGSYCPTAKIEEQRIINSPQGQAYIAKHQEMFDYLTYYSGTPITDWNTAYDLFDTLFVERRYNLVIPDWAYTYWNELKEVYDETYYLQFSSDLMKRLRGGPLVKKIIHIMEKKMMGNSPDLKFQLFSTHDDNIAVVLDIFNLFPMKEPPYASTLLFELYEGSDGEGLVRLLYLNSTRPELGDQKPHILKLHGCEEFCPLEFFIDSSRKFLPNDWKAECGITQ